MKKSIYLAAGLLVLSLCSALTEPGLPPSAPSTDQNAGKYVWVPTTNSLPRFDLNFPGGMPQELVTAVEKASDKSLNTIIPDDCRDLKIPAFSVKNVTVAQLFQALEQVSKKDDRFIVLDPRERSMGGVGSDVYPHISQYGFKTEGQPDENSIWYFYWNRGGTNGPHAPWQILASTVCRFYQLEPYLDSGYRADDITTAVETAWKMLGVTNPPAISYHKDTKVLIVVGKQDEVNLVADVLKQLPEKKLKGQSSATDEEKSGK